jgi:hypothetical protein
MGHYSLFPLFLTLGIDEPAFSAEAYATTTCTTRNNVAVGVRNDVAFPLSCIVRFRFRKTDKMPPFDLFWYDGGMKPQTPDEVLAENGALDREGIMFVGEKGKIIGQFRGETPVLYSKGKKYLPEVAAEEPADIESRDIWITSMLNNVQSPGSFQNALPVTETILLGGVALRAGKRVEYDSVNMKITNLPEADKYLTREYRKGWEL